MYGGVYDWHTLEGPFVCRRQGRYVLFYSGGNWEEPTYGVELGRPRTTRSAHGPRRRAASPLLRTVPGHVVGPGHNSLVVGPDGQDVLVYHAWDPASTARRLCIDPVDLDGAGPVVDGPSWEDADLQRSAPVRPQSPTPPASPVGAADAGGGAPP